jgi:hypothetical protein
MDADAHQVLVSPIPIFLATRSGYLSRGFSASFLVLKPFDKITSLRLWYSNKNHRTDDFISLKTKEAPELASHFRVRAYRFPLPVADSPNLTGT